MSKRRRKKGLRGLTTACLCCGEEVEFHGSGFCDDCPPRRDDAEQKDLPGVSGGPAVREGQRRA